jgi:hypothetical protein
MKMIPTFVLILTIANFSKGQELKKIEIDPTRQYKIIHEDSLLNYHDEYIKISSDLIEDDFNDSTEIGEIKLSEAKQINDTLKILIFETNEIFDYKYTINIFKGEFSIDFWYQTTMDTTDRKIETINSTLKTRFSLANQRGNKSSKKESPAFLARPL